MSDPLQALHSIRKMQQEKRRRAFVEARRVRDEQQARLDALVEEVNTIRGEEAFEEAHWVAQRDRWCLQMEMRRRREQRELDTHNAETERCRQDLATARREEQIIEVVIDEIHQTEMVEQKRQEERKFNELAAQGWWRECG